MRKLIIQVDFNLKECPCCKKDGYFYFYTINLQERFLMLACPDGCSCAIERVEHKEGHFFEQDFEDTCKKLVDKWNSIKGN